MNIPEPAIEAATKAVGHHLDVYDTVMNVHAEAREAAYAALFAAIPHLHPTVTTEAELDALPDGSIIFDGKFPLMKGNAGWCQIGVRGKLTSAFIAATITTTEPYTVLHRGADA